MHSIKKVEDRGCLQYQKYSRYLRKDWQQKTRIRQFQRQYYCEKFNSVVPFVWKALVLNKKARQNWKKKMFYIRMIRLSNLWLAWKKYRLMNQRYKRILTRVNMRKSRKILLRWKGILPTLKQQNIMKLKAFKHYQLRIFQSMRKVISQTVRQRDICLKVSRVRFLNIAKRCLQKLSNLVLQNKQNQAMAKILQKRRNEALAIKFIRLWNDSFKNNFKNRCKLNIFEQKINIVLRNLAWTGLKIFNYEEIQKEQGIRFKQHFLKRKGLMGLSKNVDSARRVHITKIGIDRRIKRDYFYVWRFLAQKLQNIRIKTQSSFDNTRSNESRLFCLEVSKEDSRLGVQILSQITLSPDSFSSFNLRHNIIPNWNEHFSLIRCEEWRRQRSLKMTFQKFNEFRVLSLKFKALMSIVEKLSQKMLKKRYLQILRIETIFKQLSSEHYTHSILARGMLGFKYNRTNKKRFKLISEFYRFRKLRSAINKLRCPIIIKQKRVNQIRPIFIQLRIFSLRSMNLKQFKEIHSKSLLQRHFKIWFEKRQKLEEFYHLTFTNKRRMLNQMKASFSLEKLSKAATSVIKRITLPLFEVQRQLPLAAITYNSLKQNQNKLQQSKINDLYSTLDEGGFNSNPKMGSFSTKYQQKLYFNYDSKNSNKGKIQQFRSPQFSMNFNTCASYLNNPCDDYYIQNQLKRQSIPVESMNNEENDDYHNSIVEFDSKQSTFLDYQLQNQSKNFKVSAKIFEQQKILQPKTRQSAVCQSPRIGSNSIMGQSSERVIDELKSSSSLHHNKNTGAIKYDPPNLKNTSIYSTFSKSWLHSNNKCEGGDTMSLSNTWSSSKQYKFQRAMTPPPGKQNVYAGYFQVYLKRQQQTRQSNSTSPNRQISLIQSSPDLIIPSKNFRNCKFGAGANLNEKSSNVQIVSSDIKEAKRDLGIEEFQLH